METQIKLVQTITNKYRKDPDTKKLCSWYELNSIKNKLADVFLLISIPQENPNFYLLFCMNWEKWNFCKIVQFLKEL